MEAINKRFFEVEFFVNKYNTEINNSYGYDNELNSNPIKGNIYKDFKK